MDSLDSPSTLLVCAIPDNPPKEVSIEIKTIFVFELILNLHI